MDEINRIIAEGANAAMSLEEIIKLEVDEWLSSEERLWMLTGQRYYNGDHDILYRKRTVIGEGGKLVEVQNLANNRLVHAFFRKLVDQKVGYLLGLAPSIQASNEQYQQRLEEILLSKSFLRTLMLLGREAIIKGKAWLHVYYDEEGQLSFKRVPAEEVIPLWRDAAHTELDGVIRVYEVEVYEGHAKKIVRRVEYWDRTGVRRYVDDHGSLIPDVELGEFDSHFVVQTKDGEVPVNWERVPFVCFKYNDDELPLIRVLKTLIDEYDRRASDMANTLEDLPNSIYVLRNYDGQDLGEFRRNLSVYRAVKVTDDGGVETLSLDIDTEAHKLHMERLRKDIYEFGRGVDTQTERFGGDKSGVALRFLYADLDMDANILETEFQASLEQLRWFIDQHIANTTGRDYSSETVDIIFSRDIIINETEVINNARASVGIISDETIIANHPWVTNVQAELERIRRQREAEITMPYSNLGAQPPADEGEQA
jgi:phage portal protein, SPP1 family